MGLSDELQNWCRGCCVSNFIDEERESLKKIFSNYFNDQIAAKLCLDFYPQDANNKPEVFRKVIEFHSRYNRALNDCSSSSEIDTAPPSTAVCEAINFMLANKIYNTIVVERYHVKFKWLGGGTAITISDKSRTVPRHVNEILTIYNETFSQGKYAEFVQQAGDIARKALANKPTFFGFNLRHDTTSALYERVRMISNNCLNINENTAPGNVM